MENIERTSKNYAFTAIVGQEEMKLALLLNIINPNIGGVLIRGEKGTAKSTAVRALADVVGPRKEVEDCIFSCDPEDPTNWCDLCKNKEDIKIKISKMKVVDLPVSATEDRVVGTLDIEHAIKYGEKRFEPGILAQANRNILYVDEVNLLDDHLVDILLDAAAMGVNTIEREGVSYSHPSKFVLVGTMNPEEGDLRPQLTDRFGLVVDVKGEDDIYQRMEVVRRRLDFENNPEEFLKAYEDDQEKLREKIIAAKEKINEVEISAKAIKVAASIAIYLEVEGHRADITMIKTAMTNAAFNGRNNINSDDLKLAAKLVLPHRLRKKPFEEEKWDLKEIEEKIDYEWNV